MSGDELARWRSSWGDAAEAHFSAAGQGKFKESAAQFLNSSWQGDALAVSACCMQMSDWGCGLIFAQPLLSALMPSGLCPQPHQVHSATLKATTSL